MKVRRRGLIRLWIVLSVIWTVGWSFYLFTEMVGGWSAADKITYDICFDSTLRDANQTSDQCLASEGVGKSVFEREHTTAFAWWGTVMGISFLADLVVTALLVGVFFVLRWVVRGFGGDPKREG